MSTFLDRIVFPINTHTASMTYVLPLERRYSNIRWKDRGIECQHDRRESASGDHECEGIPVGGCDVRLCFPKGLVLHFFFCGYSLFISKDGIARYLRMAYREGWLSGFLTSLWVRNVAIAEVIVFAIVAPFILATYLIGIPVFLLGALFWSATACVRFDVGATSLNNRQLCADMWLLLFKDVVSLLLTLCYVALMPIQVLLPEVMVFLFRYHRWSTVRFDYFEPGALV